ncbi:MULTISPECIES: hypothetical protein [unclassified Aeromonas]|uniref:hypothetical protein n=1 Tax=unclassified Aeromonas TaxID=257493 RepID=UPI003B9F3AB2
MKNILLAVLLTLCGISTHASEYCLERFNEDIRKANVELSDKLTRLDALQTILVNVQKDKDITSKEMADIVHRDPSLSIPTNRDRMKYLSEQYDVLDRNETEAKSESFQIQDRVFSLKNTIPANLAGQLRGCVEVVKPANTLVNTVIQAIAILSTGGASLSLPPKALYVDMGQVLNGYPLGGPQSVVNETRQAVLNALGIGGENNDIGKIIKDPGRIIRCLFGC